MHHPTDRIMMHNCEHCSFKYLSLPQCPHPTPHPPSFTCIRQNVTISGRFPTMIAKRATLGAKFVLGCILGMLSHCRNIKKHGYSSTLCKEITIFCKIHHFFFFPYHQCVCFLTEYIYMLMIQSNAYSLKYPIN